MEPYNTFVGSQLFGFSFFCPSQSTAKLGKNFLLIEQSKANFDYPSELLLCVSPFHSTTNYFQHVIDASLFETDCIIL